MLFLKKKKVNFLCKNPHSVQFSRSFMSDSLRPHGLQHARPSCSSPTHGVYSNMSIASVMPSIPFSSCLQSFPASGSFPMSQFLRIRWPKYWSFSFSIIPSNEYSGLISFEWTSWISLQSKGLSRVFSNTTVKASIFHHSAFFIVQLSHPYRTTGKTIALTRWTFVGKLTSLLFNKLSRLVIAFLPRSKRLLISWL